MTVFRIGDRKGVVRAFLASLCLPLGLALAVATAHAQEPAASDAALQRLLDDYIRLYRRETLDEWRKLFLPSFVVASTNPDGSTAVRTLDEFWEAQRQGFASARSMGEVLENVRTEQRGRLASVWADFVFTSDDTSRRGRLVMLCIAERGVFRIHALMFSYHD